MCEIEMMKLKGDNDFNFIVTNQIKSFTPLVKAIKEVHDQLFFPIDGHMCTFEFVLLLFLGES